MCQLCTVGVIAGLGLSRWLGIDDTVSGIWIGGLLVSISGWTVNGLRSRNINFRFMPFLVTLTYYFFAVMPLYWAKIIGHPNNTFWGLDKFVLGIMIGSIFFTTGYVAYRIAKKNNGGKAIFPFSRVVLPITPLIILSIIFYYLTLK